MILTWKENGRKNDRRQNVKAQERSYQPAWGERLCGLERHKTSVVISTHLCSFCRHEGESRLLSISIRESNKVSVCP